MNAKKSPGSDSDVTNGVNGSLSQPPLSPTGTVIVKPTKPQILPIGDLRIFSRGDGTFDTKFYPIEPEEHQEHEELEHDTNTEDEVLSNGVAPLSQNGDTEEAAAEAEPKEVIQEEVDELREEIRNLQIQAVSGLHPSYAYTTDHPQHDSFTNQTKALLTSYLPPYILQTDPCINPAHPANPNSSPNSTPTLLDLEVTRAKSSAELNIYLSHIRPTQKKIDFLTAYSALEEQTLKTDEIKNAMEKLAKMCPLKDENGKTIMYTDEERRRKEYFGSKRSWTGAKSAVHRLGPLLPRGYVEPTVAAVDGENEV